MIGIEVVESDKCLLVFGQVFYRKTGMRQSKEVAFVTMEQSGRLCNINVHKGIEIKVEQ